MTDRPDLAGWIAERRELLDAATEGPWYDMEGIDWEASVGGGGLEVADTGEASDAALIADARTSLPRALDALEAVLAPHQLHEVPGGQRWCLHCGGDWPCPTVAAITEALS